MMCGAVAGIKGTGAGANEIALRWDVVGQVAIGVGRPSADAAARLIAGLRVLDLGSCVGAACCTALLPPPPAFCCLSAFCACAGGDATRGGAAVWDEMLGKLTRGGLSVCGCLWAWQARRQTEPGIL